MRRSRLEMAKLQIRAATRTWPDCTWGILPSMRLFPLLPCLSLAALAQEIPAAAGRGGRGGPESKEPIDESTFSALKTRQIGPAFVSGRISQTAVFPNDSNHYLVAVASGNIFATTNNGTTWTPVFDNYGAYSIGWITID